MRVTDNGQTSVDVPTEAPICTCARTAKRCVRMSFMTSWSWRRDLLDLTARNRLLNTPRTNSRSGRLDIVDELSEEVFRLLVVEKKAMTFLHRDEGSDDDDDATASDRATETWEYDDGFAGVRPCLQAYNILALPNR